jgi:DNA-binding beta-propeller fold protein YncE
MRVAAGLLMALSVTALSVGAQAQTLETATYKTSGHPTEAVASPDGQYVLVTVDHADSAGLDVFHSEGGKLKRVAFQPLSTEGAQGILLIPGTRMLAVGASNKGVAFLSLDEAITGKAKAQLLPQGERSGSGYLAVTPDGQYLFVANEYGDGGNIGVIALHPDEAGAIHPETVAHIPTPNTTPGVTISADGRRLYTEGEITSPEAASKISGHGVKELEREGCTQARPERRMPNGVLYAIDVEQARQLTRDTPADQVRRVLRAAEDAGCSPVRETVTPDGSTIYVTARGDDRVLVFDAKALENDRDHAFLRAIPSGGAAPVGLKLFAGGKALLVANSNRFANGPGNAAVFDLSDPAKPVLRQTIKTGAFPRNITSSADGATLYLTIFSGDELMVLTPKP